MADSQRRLILGNGQQYVQSVTKVFFGRSPEPPRSYDDARTLVKNGVGTALAQFNSLPDEKKLPDEAVFCLRLQLPIELHGRDRVHKHTEAGCEPVTPPAAKLMADGKIQLAGGEILEMRGPEHSQNETGGDDSPPEVVTGMDLRPKEGFSSTKVSRGDRRWTFPNELTSTRLFWSAIAQTVELSSDEF